MKNYNTTDYVVQEDGKVYSKRRNIFLKPGTSKGGYLKVYLYENLGYGKSSTKIDSRYIRKRKVVSLHRLVAAAFLEDYSEDLQVNHKDNDKTNNHVSNLEMVTPLENMRHAYNTGRMDNLIKVQKLSKKLGIRIEKAAHV